VNSGTNADHPIFVPGFDALRVAAAFAVVYIHGAVSNPALSNWSSWAAFAVPSFFLMAGFLIAHGLAHRANQDFGQFAMARLRRLLPAYLAWSTLYLVLRALKIGLLQGEGWQAALNINWLTWLLIGGYTYHLWFVPTLLYFSIALYLILKQTERFSWVGRLVTLFALAISTFLLYGHLVGVVEAQPGIENYLTRYVARNFGFSILGAALFFILRDCPKWRPMAMAAAGFSWIGVVLLTTGVYSATSEILWLLGITLGVFMLALLEKRRSTGLLSRLASVSFGIYLVHAVFLEMFRIALRSMQVAMSVEVTIGLIIFAFIASGIFALNLAKNSKLKWLAR
jgi:peptidoglycan/LPS O-acetylase OafA/YrhL